MILNNSNCCPDAGLDSKISITRFIVADLSRSKKMNLIRTKRLLTQELVDFKALSKRNGNTRVVRESKAQFSGVETKRLGRTLLSLATPGDSDPIRSPVRSAIYRTLTPGKPGVPGSIPTKPARGYRCPEGYQFGGRFTDSRLSTCGAKLFDIPSPLGLALRALRRSLRYPKLSTTDSKPIATGPAGGSLIESRKPQIPKVSLSNSRLASQQAKEMIKQMGEHNGKVARLVRRDGFTLEPVVPAKVLRAIPDNRDMEGAVYLISAFSPADIGNDELGLLSNTGVYSIVYVMPGGSTLTLKKQRKLSIGERRKLGRTVNSSMSINNTKDPSARLKAVAQETGNGMGYFEDFNNIKNPNEIINGKQRWAVDAFKRRNSKLSRTDTQAVSRDTVSSAPIKGKINSVDKAIAHLSSGGSLSDISPSIMAEVLTNSQDIKIEQLGNNQSLITYGNKKYFLYSGPSKNQHIDEMFSSDVQQYIGLESPDIVLASKEGLIRPYLREDVETAFQGAKFNPGLSISNLSANNVAMIMVSDFLTDQENRPLSSIYPMDSASGIVPMLAENTISELADLDKISITKRTKMNIEEFYRGSSGLYFSKYYQELKAEQRIIFRKTLDKLITRLKLINLANMRARFEKNGLSVGEKQHLEIVFKLFTNRLDSLSGSKRSIIKLLEGKK